MVALRPPAMLQLALLGAASLAGCFGAGPKAPLDDGAGDGPLVPALDAPVIVSKDWPGAEPVIAIASDGTLYVEGIGSNDGLNIVNKVFRSTDDGATWTDVTPPGLGQEGSNDGFLAVGNGDRVYVVNVFSLTFQLFRSDDRGATWIPLPAPHLPLLMHRNWVVPVGESTLHVVVEALPPSFLVPPLTLAANEGLWYLRSHDRGLTWTVPVQIDPLINFAGQSNLVADREGTHLYVARYADEKGPNEPTYLRGLWYLIASEDGGATWQRRDMFPLTSELAAAVPSLALDDRGTLYFAWSQDVEGASQLHLARSTDGGRTWGPPLLPVPTDGTQSMPWIDARAPGELGLVWYEADEPGRASKIDAPWFVEYALLAGADGDRPRAHVARATPDPVHEGNICARGPACGGGEDRSLLDYIWLEFGPDRRAHFVVGSTKWDRPTAFPVYGDEKTPLDLPARLA